MTSVEKMRPGALAITIAILIAGAVVVEHTVLRPLANRSPMTLFMATLGLSFVIEGLSQIAMGASVHELDLGIIDTPIQFGEIQVSQFDLVAAATAGILVVALSIFFNKTRIGISLRAIADDPQAALSIGIRLQTLWQIVWGVAGFVSLVAGLLWGARQGVQFALADANVLLRTMRWLTWEAAKKQDAGLNARIEASIAKLYWGSWHRRLGELAMDILGPAATVLDGEALPENGGYGLGEFQRSFLSARAETIYGGSNQIQRNIIGERVLGLPPEPKGVA